MNQALAIAITMNHLNANRANSYTCYSLRSSIWSHLAVVEQIGTVQQSPNQPRKLPPIQTVPCKATCVMTGSHRKWPALNGCPYVSIGKPMHEWQGLETATHG